jgi:aconitate decarboxylase
MEETVEAPRGSETSFASDADVIAKFRKLAARRIPDAQAARIVEQVMGVERLASAADLVRSLAGARA